MDRSLFLSGLLTKRMKSNILQDIDSLHLFARVVTDICRSCDEQDILRNAFELLCAFDEIISVGYRDNVNLSQVKSIIEMESHEERLQEAIAKVCKVAAAAACPFPHASFLTLLT